MSPKGMITLTVADVMQRWPDTVQIFNAHRMACPGCIMAPFMTVADAADAYQLDEDELAAELAATTRLEGDAGSPSGLDEGSVR